jgi:hypothetical protein
VQRNLAAFERAFIEHPKLMAVETIDTRTLVVLDSIRPVIKTKEDSIRGYAILDSIMPRPRRLLIDDLRRIESKDSTMLAAYGCSPSLVREVADSMLPAGVKFISNNYRPGDLSIRLLRINLHQRTINGRCQFVLSKLHKHGEKETIPWGMYHIGEWGVSAAID